MRRPTLLVVLIASCTLMLGGCFRTRYVNLTPQLQKASVQPPADRQPRGSWQSFFLYGWTPSEKRIDAGEACGGFEHVDRIETERSFLQGLVAAFAGYYVNIYSPYTGGVVCDAAGEK